MHRATVSGGPYTQLGELIPQVTESEIPEFTDVVTGDMEEDYFYVVTATDGRNISDFSNEVTVNIDTIAPASPGMLRVIVEGSVQLIVNGPVTISN